MIRVRVSRKPHSKSLTLDLNYNERRYRYDLTAPEAVQLGQSLLLAVQVELPDTREEKKHEIENHLHLAFTQIQHMEHDLSGQDRLSGTKSEADVRAALEKLQSASRLVGQATSEIAGVSFPRGLPRERG